MEHFAIQQYLLSTNPKFRGVGHLQLHRVPGTPPWHREVAYFDASTRARSVSPITRRATPASRGKPVRTLDAMQVRLHAASSFFSIALDVGTSEPSQEGELPKRSTLQEVCLSIRACAEEHAIEMPLQLCTSPPTYDLIAYGRERPTKCSVRASTAHQRLTTAASAVPTLRQDSHTDATAPPCAASYDH
ncbi:hypothetical protein M011DRAFT_212691 [Sporormia fimetaria CBS 119925]|uniref:Uncharacterized protein n=1 Tax=Sporormia fimetaria CBS 119925 TaxID=1340428 RepID=A0A6A6V3A4_9PLEO|nr:hypothetical protein M011DRAFT_212691 [Sporormia fimetaria CBS 119925]